jgi:hypothetical protein
MSPRKSAEEKGFEPLVPFGTAVFKTAAFDHSATPPGTCSAGEIFTMGQPASTCLFGLCPTGAALTPWQMLWMALIGTGSRSRVIS